MSLINKTLILTISGMFLIFAWSMFKLSAYIYNHDPIFAGLTWVLIWSLIPLYGICIISGISITRIIKIISLGCWKLFTEA